MKKWLNTWKQELVGIPLALVLFYYSPLLFRAIDPTAGVYDIGILQTVIVSCFKFIIYAFIGWVILRHGFKSIWDYFEDGFEKDFEDSPKDFKIKIGLAVFFIVILLLTMLDSATSKPSNCVIQTARTQIGVKESTGDNDGEDVEKYLKSVVLPKGHPWCAAFCAWVYDQCHIPHPRSGYSPAWFTTKTVYLRDTEYYDDMVGSVFGIWFNEKNRIAHMGIIEEIQDGLFVTIEGNTNDFGGRDGDGVYRKRRLIRQVYAVRVL